MSPGKKMNLLHLEFAAWLDCNSGTLIFKMVLSRCRSATSPFVVIAAGICLLGGLCEVIRTTRAGYFAPFSS